MKRCMKQEKNKETKAKFDNLKNKLLLALILFIFHYLLSFVVDDSCLTYYLSGNLPLSEFIKESVIIFISSYLFVELSICYSRWIFRHFFYFEKPYRSLFVHSILLLLLNNFTAYIVTVGIGGVFDDGLNFFHQGLYILSVLVTFVSGIYTNAQYLDAYMEVLNQKKELEINLLREKELTVRMQLNVLKAQIDPHFMFNNFSILSELIEVDKLTASKFLDNLSIVYRYVIQNLQKDIISIHEELTFLYSYIYLIKIRHEAAVCIKIEKGLEGTEGNILPVCLQMLVENAIKHNRISEQQPLEILIYRDDDYIVVQNPTRPLSSTLGSTGIGHQNIMERYALLCGKQPVIKKNNETYIVKLPIIRTTL